MWIQTVKQLIIYDLINHEASALKSSKALVKVFRQLHSYCCTRRMASLQKAWELYSSKNIFVVFFKLFSNLFFGRQYHFPPLYLFWVGIIWNISGEILDLLFQWSKNFASVFKKKCMKHTFKCPSTIMSEFPLLSMPAEFLWSKNPNRLHILLSFWKLLMQSNLIRWKWTY